MTSTEVAWAAGLFEGEGSVLAENQKGRKYLRFCLATTDRDVIERFAVAMGCGKIYGPYNQGHAKWKPRYDWRTKNHAEALRATELLRPYLGVRRLAQLNAAVEAIENQRPRRTRGWKHPPETIEKMRQAHRRRWAGYSSAEREAVLDGMRRGWGKRTA